MSSIGGGIRNKKNKIGKINTVSTLEFDRISVIPIKNTGIDMM